ncbi:MAG TPA: YihY/virulence factor BrkB family protein [bacterium]|nr:YihY/virulence factor BrkB family protein [bacterium]
MISKLVGYLTRDIWRIPIRKIKGPRGFFIRTVRIIVLSLREFSSDHCSLRASALTFYSLLSVVPVFAMAFGVAKGFGVDKLLREKLMENLQGQQEALNRILEISDSLLQNTKGGVIAGIGLIILFWTVIQVLSNIEISFNHIWGIKKNRTLGRKFTDYLALMLIVPIFFVVASSATVFVVSQVQLITQKMAILGVLGPVILTCLQILPFAVFWGLLTYLYIFLPNGKIHFQSALIGGIVAGTIYQLVQWVYIHFQIGVSKAGAIYGSFAALPLFLIWLQMSWRIVLYGAELSFAHQNEERFEFEQDCLSASEGFKKLLALRITQVCVSRFAAGEEALSAEAIASQLDLPIRLTRDLLDRLTKAGVVALVSGEDERVRHYQPARDVGEMTIQYVLEKMEQAGAEDIPLSETPELEKLRVALRRFDQALQNLPENALLKDLSPAVAPSKVFV